VIKDDFPDKDMVLDNYMTETQEKITHVFNSMQDVVIEKNKRYGDVALSPKKIFSKLEPGKGIMHLLRVNGQRVKSKINQRKGYQGRKRGFTRECKERAVELALRPDRNLSQIAHRLGINGNIEAGGEVG
jgi:hypothetical protein